MPPSDFRLPDDFPDMRLPERTEQPQERIPPQQARWPEEPQHSVSRSLVNSWKVGDRVLAPWEPIYLYAGRISQFQDNQALIEFDDGDVGWVLLEQIRPLEVHRGQQVLSRRRMGHHFFLAEILEVRGEEVLVGFTDGQGDEWTRVAALRIPCQEQARGAAPASVASHLAFYQNLQPGERVWAPWKSDTLQVGTVDQIEDREVHIRFDDGNCGWVLLEQLVPLTIPVGLRVQGRWKMGLFLYPGTISDVRGDQIHINYDDGDREWTRPAALVLPCDPVGPAARPTKVVRRWFNHLYWAVPVAIGVLLAFSRGGCR